MFTSDECEQFNLEAKKLSEIVAFLFAAFDSPAAHLVRASSVFSTTSTRSVPNFGPQQNRDLSSANKKNSKLASEWKLYLLPEDERLLARFINSLFPAPSLSRFKIFRQEPFLRIIMGDRLEEPSRIKFSYTKNYEALKYKFIGPNLKESGWFISDRGIECFAICLNFFRSSRVTANFLNLEII